MNKDLLLNKLNETFKGKTMPSGSYSFYQVEREILNVVHNLLREEGFSEQVIAEVRCSRGNYKHFYYYISYKGYSIIGFDIQRERGKWKGSYFENQYDWLYKSFTSTWEDFDFSKKVVEINQAVLRDQRAKIQKENFLYSIYKKLKVFCGEENYIGTIIDALHKQQYSLSSRWEKDNTKVVEVKALPKVMSDYSRRLDDMDFNINILYQDVESQKCDWENADVDDLPKETLKRLKENNLTADMVVEELGQVLDILEDVKKIIKVIKIDK